MAGSSFRPATNAGDTPFENIFEIVKVAKEFGTYPLDIDKITDELQRLGQDQG